MAAPLYNAEILKLAASITEDTLLEHPDARVERHSPVCGSRVTIDVVLGADGHILACGAKVRACALGQASAAILAQRVVGMRATDLRAVHHALKAWLAAGAEGAAPLPEAVLAAFPKLALFASARPLKARHPSILLSFDAAAAAAEEALLGISAS